VAADPDIARALEWLRRSEPERAMCELGAAGEPARAAAAFERALALRPSYPEAATNLGSLLLERGDVLEALKAFDGALVARAIQSAAARPARTR